MGLSNASASNRAIILAALAIVSAILSNFAGHDGILWTRRVAVWEVPLLPGVFFGTVLALAIWLWVSRRIFTIAVILLATVLAWFAAWTTALYAFESIQKMLETQEKVIWPPIPGCATATSLGHYPHSA